MSNLSTLKLYFPNLTGLRFIAASFVIINHTEQLKLFYKIGGEISVFSRLIGKLGVMLFYVLSGFLITYILLSEEKITKKIEIKKFYARRFLRIVPLYLLITFVVFFFINKPSLFEIPYLKNPTEHSFITIFLLHIFFLPNLVTSIYGFVPHIAQAWSVGTEIQAYLLWPQLLKKFAKHRLFLMIAVIIFHSVVRLILSERLSLAIPHRKVLLSFWIHFNIDIIAIGSLFALILFTNHKVLTILLNKVIFVSCLIITILLLAFAINIPFFHYVTYSFLFGLIILNLAKLNPHVSILEWKPIAYLGKISYGIYMYHLIILTPVLILSKELNIQNNLFIYSILITTTVVVSSISYHFFENYFLKMKLRYSFIRIDNKNNNKSPQKPVQ